MTRAATTTSCTMMRMLVGMVLRISEMITLEKASTAITDMPMTRAGSSFAVTARQEHIPSTCTTTGLSLEKGLKKICLLLILSAMTGFIWRCVIDFRLRVRLLFWRGCGRPRLQPRRLPARSRRLSRGR